MLSRRKIRGLWDLNLGFDLLAKGTKLLKMVCNNIGFTNKVRVN